MNILIVYGGKSCEHDISILTGCLAKGYFDGNIYSVYFDKQNQSFLVPNDFTPAKHLKTMPKNKVSFCFGEGKIAIYRGKLIKKFVSIDVAVNCCHGVHGEDGSIASLCKMSNIPLVGSDILPSAIAMDKIVTKRMLKYIGAPHLYGKGVTKRQFENGGFNVGYVGYPVIVKPATLGSSIGVAVCRDGTQLQSALKNAFSYDEQVLCERALASFYEVNCSAMQVDGDVVLSDVDMPYTTNDILTFADKYLQDAKWCKPSQNVPQQTATQVKFWTKKIYRQLGFSGVIRVDFLVDNATQKVYVNEVNAIPGSLAYGLWAEKYTQKQFGNLLAREAIAQHKIKNQLVYDYNSTVLDGKMRKK